MKAMNRDKLICWLITAMLFLVYWWIFFYLQFNDNHR